MELAIPITPIDTIPIKTVGDFCLPIYGLGTWGMGGTFQADCAQDEQCIGAIRRCVQAGVTHIDTAEMYGNGHAEELVGVAMKDYDRGLLFIGSKALGHHLRYDDLIAAAEASIRRMDCEYLDLYMIHHPSDEVPIEDTMRGMDELVRRGLVHHVGVCNFTKERLERAQDATDNKIVCNQVHYSLAVREPETTGLLEHCQRNNVMLVAWQPIDRGVYKDAPLPLMRQLCEKYKCTPVQLALSFVTSQCNVTAISKTMSAEHLAENIAGANIQMEAADVEALRAGYQQIRERSEVYALR